MADPLDSESKNNNTEAGEDNEEDKPSCYVCWDDDDTANDENPLRRDCGCLGTSGWVHLQCLIATAETKGRSNLLFDPLIRPWMHCNQCQQPYKDPTKRALTEAMVERGPHWTERVTSAALTAGQSLLLYSVLFLHASFVGCAIDFVLKAGESTVLPCMASWWEDASERTHRTVFLAFGLGVLWFLYCHRWQFLRALSQFVAIGSTMVAVAVLIEGDFREKCIALACSVPVAAVLVYRARREIRQEAMRLQRRGIVAFLLALALSVVLVFLRYHIEKRVANFYFRHVEPYSTGEKVSELMKLVQVMPRETAYEFERRIKVLPGFDMYVRSQQPFPPEARLEEYWKCCI